jgi:hypothetical protein
MLLLYKYKKMLKFILVFDLKAFVCKKPNDLLKQHMYNKSSDKKEFYLTINLLYPREESLQFFSKNYVFLYMLKF